MEQCKIILILEDEQEKSIVFNSENYTIDKRINPREVSDDGTIVSDPTIIYNIYIEEPIGKNILSEFFENLFIEKQIIDLNSFKYLSIENLNNNKIFSSNDLELQNFGIMYHIATVDNVVNNCVINFNFTPKENSNG